MDLYSTLAFVLVTSITPGPNNLSCFTFSMAIGYRKTLNYIFGIIVGTWLVLLICGILVDVFSAHFENIESVLKYLAAAYILFLAYKSLKLNVSKKVEVPESPTFINGFLLQLVNPKAIFFGITLFTGFLHSVTANILTLIFSVFLISIVTFTMVSLWSIAGGLILKYLKNNLVLKIVSILMAVLLVAFAIKIALF